MDLINQRIKLLSYFIIFDVVGHCFNQETQEQELVEKYSTDVDLILKDPVTILPRKPSK